MFDPAVLPSLSPDQLRELAESLLGQVRAQEQELAFRQAKIDKLTHELALHKRWRFAARAEACSPEQRHLFEETLDTDLAAIEVELSELKPASPPPTSEKRKPRRLPLPPELPRRVIEHEPDTATCTCGCALQRIGEDIAEKLDYIPGVFTVEHHVRGKWVCRQCETLIQAPVPAHVIDKGLPTTGLLAQVLVAKFHDHLPLYRQEAIFGRAGWAVPRSTLAQWVGQCGVALQPLADALKAELLRQPVLHADETPVAMLNPGAGKTHRAYLWAYGTTAFADLKGVLYDFTNSRAGQHAKNFLGEWRGTLVCDDYAGYKDLFTKGVTEAGCLAHARRKFFDLQVQHQSPVAGEALEHFQGI
jgi:transposase